MNIERKEELKDILIKYDDIKNHQLIYLKAGISTLGLNTNDNLVKYVNSFGFGCIKPLTPNKDDEENLQYPDANMNNFAYFYDKSEDLSNDLFLDIYEEFYKTLNVKPKLVSNVNDEGNIIVYNLLSNAPHFQEFKSLIENIGFNTNVDNNSLNIEVNMYKKNKTI